MCRLYAVTAAVPKDISSELASFFEGSVLHSHGWGWAAFNKGRTRIYREPIAAYKSKYAQRLTSDSFRIKDALFHIRYATVGDINSANTHPLTILDDTGRQWTIIHNGTVFNFDALEDLFSKQTTSTDTELLLMYIVERINKAIAQNGATPGAQKRFEIVSQAISALAKGNKINIILTDGNLLYVHANARHGSRCLGDAAKDDYLYETVDAAYGSARTFSTVPLDSRPWTPMPLNTVSAYRDGALIYRSKPHDYEYIETDEDIKYLYSGSAGL